MDPIPAEIVCIRHGRTEWSASGRHTGRTDILLDDEGVEQARALGERLGPERFDLVLSSPLGRALETCRLAGLGDSVEIRDDLSEWDYGLYEGLTTHEIRAQRPGWLLFRDGCPEGERAADVGERADRVISQLTRDRSVAGGRVAIFGHGHALRVLAARWMGLPPEGGRLLRLDTASVSILSWEHDHRVLSCWNVRR